MKTAKLRLIRSFDDHEPVILGHITVPYGIIGDNIVRVLKNIETMFAEFQNLQKQPNDSEFVKWLCDNHKEIKSVDDEFTDVVLE